jgi:hypothetical protein
MDISDNTSPNDTSVQVTTYVPIMTEAEFISFIINYVLFCTILVANIVISVYFFNVHKKKTSYLFITGASVCMLLEAVFETLLSLQCENMLRCLVYDILALTFTRVAMLLYMILVVSRLSLIRFHWRLRLIHFVILYTVTSVGWLVSIVVNSMQRIGFVIPEYSDWSNAINGGNTITYVSYSIIVAATAISGTTVMRIIFSKRTDAEKTKTLQWERKLYLMFFLSNVTFAMGLLFWILAEYTLMEDSIGNWVLWIIQYSALAVHFTFETFFQHNLSRLLEEISGLSDANLPLNPTTATRRYSLTVMETTTGLK